MRSAFLVAPPSIFLRDSAQKFLGVDALPSVDGFGVVIQETFDIASTKAVPRARQGGDDSLLEQSVVKHLMIPFFSEELDRFPLFLYLH